MTVFQSQDVPVLYLGTIPPRADHPGTSLVLLAISTPLLTKARAGRCGGGRLRATDPAL